MLVVFIAISGILSAGAPNAQSELSAESKSVLARMDQAASKLSSLTADFKLTKVTVVVDDVSKESGKLFYQRNKKTSTTKLDYEKPVPKTLFMEKGRVQILEPRIRRLQEFDLRQSRGQAELRLFWFGQSSNNIRKDYDVRFLREEAIDGQKASVLELTPRSPEISAMFVKIVLWVDHNLWIPVQTKLTEASDDHMTIRLENIRINPPLGDSAFELKVPSGYTKVKPNLPR